LAVRLFLFLITSFKQYYKQKHNSMDSLTERTEGRKIANFRTTKYDMYNYRFDEFREKLISEY
jgi:hypothetical protein